MLHVASLVLLFFAGAPTQPALKGLGVFISCVVLALVHIALERQ